ncbi:PH domain-containing protein [Ruminococcaceae bacterium OttesenSCG-928-A11]|nr:PH domain-containing protein [Ruminococcaceae bacterium OttesenSCG-928-A11]
MPNTENDDILWKDRKRILGLPISFTRYEVTNDRFVMHSGLFSTTTDEMLLYRILDIKMVRKFSQKIFGVGTITLYSADKTHGEHEIKNIKKPNEVRKFLSKIVEQERHTKGVTGREMYGAAAGGNTCGERMEFVDVDGDGIPD